MLDPLAFGLTAMINGFLTIAGTVISPAGLAILTIAASFTWLALCEAELLDRSGYKPDVPTH